MEIDVTTLVTEDFDPHEFSDSQYHSGLDNIGEITWQAALEQADETPLLTTVDQLVAMADHILKYGAWSKAEVDAMTVRDLNAFLIQEVASAVHESNGEGSDFLAAKDGQAYFYIGY